LIGNLPQDGIDGKKPAGEMKMKKSLLAIVLGAATLPLTFAQTPATGSQSGQTDTTTTTKKTKTTKKHAKKNKKDNTGSTTTPSQK
jgi:hypothetical protein